MGIENGMIEIDGFYPQTIFLCLLLHLRKDKGLLRSLLLVKHGRQTTKTATLTLLKGTLNEKKSQQKHTKKTHKTSILQHIS
ncbi:MAG: hypothetical protein C1942_02925 [Prosthecochloris sp.]|nr:hypothetical protein [Prosthecochloris sp.]